MTNSFATCLRASMLCASLLAISAQAHGSDDAPSAEEIRANWDHLLSSGSIDKDGNRRLVRSELASFIENELARNGDGDDADARAAQASKLSKALLLSADLLVVDSQIDEREWYKFVGDHRFDEYRTNKGAILEDFIALALGGKLPPAPKKDDDDEEESFLDRFSLRQSYFIASNVAKPATLTWTQYGPDDDTRTTDRSVFAAEGALAYVGTETERRAWGRVFDFRPVVVVEADISSGDPMGGDLVRHHIGLSGATRVPCDANGGEIDQTPFSYDFTFDFITDDDYNAEVYGATFQVTRSLPSWAIGESVKFKSFGRQFEFRWRPYLGLKYGEVRDDAGKAGFMSRPDYFDTYLTAAADLLIGERAHLNLRASFYKELSSGSDTHNFIEASFIYDLYEKDDTNAGITLSYRKGEREPLYLDEDRAQVALTLAF